MKPENLIAFTPAKLERFKIAYEAAVETAAKSGIDTFTFDGHEVLISYAKYVIEYLELRFSRDRMF